MAVLDKALAVVIMAAGKGTRMNSELPKVLHRIGGKSLLEHVLATSAKIGALRTVVVVGHQREMVMESVGRPGLQFAVQDPPLGTGHAVQQAAVELSGFSGEVLVLSGDVPLLRPQTLGQLISTHRAGEFGVTVLTATAPDPFGYGRIVRSADGQFERIVEEREATDEIKRITEINSGIYCFNSVSLFETLPQLQPSNSKGEYYLTDTIELIRAHGEAVQAAPLAAYREICGINTPAELAAAEGYFLGKQA